MAGPGDTRAAFGRRGVPQPSAAQAAVAPARGGFLPLALFAALLLAVDLAGLLDLLAQAVGLPAPALRLGLWLALACLALVRLNRYRGRSFTGDRGSSSSEPAGDGWSPFSRQDRKDDDAGMADYGNGGDSGGDGGGGGD